MGHSAPKNRMDGIRTTACNPFPRMVSTNGCSPSMVALPSRTGSPFLRLHSWVGMHGPRVRALGHADFTRHLGVSQRSSYLTKDSHSLSQGCVGGGVTEYENPACSASGVPPRSHASDSLVLPPPSAAVLLLPSLPPKQKRRDWPQNGGGGGYGGMGYRRV
jgi:hypothetical protein